MEWFDGTFKKTYEKIEAAFPVFVTEDLRANATKDRIALINRFPDGSPFLDLSDPDIESESETEFYHVFEGADAVAAKNLISDFLASGHGANAEEIDLLRDDGEQLFEYSFGTIRRELVDDQDALRKLLPVECRDRDIFVLPLKLFRYPCPVCHNRTLQWRGWFEICPECGWEDDGEDNEDVDTMANGSYTIRTYRKKYLKLKYKNPAYRWFDSFKH